MGRGFEFQIVPSFARVPLPPHLLSSHGLNPLPRSVFILLPKPIPPQNPFSLLFVLAHELGSERGGGLGSEWERGGGVDSAGNVPLLQAVTISRGNVACCKFFSFSLLFGEVVWQNTRFVVFYGENVSAKVCVSSR